MSAVCTYTEFARGRVAKFSNGFGLKFDVINFPNRCAIVTAAVVHLGGVVHLAKLHLHERETIVFMDCLDICIDHVLPRSVLVRIETRGPMRLVLTGSEALPLCEQPPENGPSSTPKKPEKNGDGP